MKKLKQMVCLLCALLACAGCAAAQQVTFSDDFNGTALDTNKWLIANRAWGGNNGGVVPANVSVSGGTLKLEGHGDQYRGSVAGINRPNGTRTGAAIATREYLGSGSYEIVAKAAPQLGACSAMWTFEYEEYYPGDPIFEACAPSGATYYAVNHEIDIELPGRPSSAVRKIDFRHALLTTWTGELNSEHVTNYTKLSRAQNDGKFHTYRFDWHTGDSSTTPRVEFYIDGKKVAVSTKNIPTNASRLWLGLWFPNGWAGTPKFNTTVFEVDSVKFTPFHEAGDTPQKETYGTHGWAEGSFASEQPANLLVNGDFASGTIGWTYSGSATVENERAVLPASKKTGRVAQRIAVKPNTTYTLRADVVTTGTKVDLGVSGYDKHKSDKISSYTKVENGSLTFTTGRTTKQVTVYARVLGKQKHANVVTVDNVSLAPTAK